jgi:uncharacterized protein YhaN
VVAARRDTARSALQSALGAPEAGGPLAPVLAAAERRRRELEQASQERRLAQADLEQIKSDEATGERRRFKLDEDLASNAAAWAAAIAEAGLTLDIDTSAAVLDLLDELREATASEANLKRRVEGIGRDAREHAARVARVADAIGTEAGETPVRLRGLRDRLAAARSAAALLGSLDDEERRRTGQAAEADAKLRVADDALGPLLAETGAIDRAELGAAIERSRAMRGLTDEVDGIERRIVDEGDGMALVDLLSAVATADPATIAGHISQLNVKLDELNAAVDEAATAHGDARQLFSSLDVEGASAADAAADAEQAKSELEVLAEHYILKRAQAVTLRWAIEQYRERNQDPLLTRAGELFSILTTGNYSTLRVDTDGPSPRLLGMRADGRTLVEVGGMSEGTTDQLFLALRLAALEQSVAAGVTLPFLADDLFVNFDDERAEAGFRVLAEVAKSTQVLFFTHHPHLVTIARSVVGAELHSECALV